MLCTLDNPALRGIFAHELAHLRKWHTVKILLFFVAFILVLVLVYLFVTKTLIPFALTFTIGALVFSLIAWHFEYEADGVGSDFVQKECMANALEQAAKVIARPGHSFTHPSFKKRISHLLSERP
jgi:Zn-dependent protease with chaperone function